MAVSHPAEVLRRKASPGELDTVRAVLDDLGLTQSENIVFATLLRVGSRPASTLAKLTSISRGHIYGILDRLVRRALVSVHERGGVRYFSALSLEDLLRALEEKEAVLATRREQLREILCSFQRPSSQLWSDPQTKSDRGPETKARIFQELTKVEPEGAILFCSAEESALFDQRAPEPDAVLHLLHMIPAQFVLVLFSQDDSAYRLAEAVHQARVVPLRGNLASEMVVSGNRVTLVGTRGQAPCSITVDQPALAANLRFLAHSLVHNNGSRPN